MLPDTVAGEAIAGEIERECPGAIESGIRDRGELILLVGAERIREVCAFLRRSAGFSRLCAVTAVDRFPGEPRFEVVYQLHSIERGERLRLKCRVGGQDPEIDSVTGVWPGADWYEREVFDLFGVGFRGHPNLKRILMPEDWDGHPLRKDYPVHGHKYDYQDD